MCARFGASLAFQRQVGNGAVAGLIERSGLVLPKAPAGTDDAAGSMRDRQRRREYSRRRRLVVVSRYWIARPMTIGRAETG
jgi:hypothetical protein